MIYDAFLQLGISMFLWDYENWDTMQLTNNTIKQDIKRAISGMRNHQKDPARGISHKGIQEFLAERRKTYCFLKEFQEAFCQLKDMRNFVHYAPRLRRTPSGTLLFDICEYQPEDLQRALKQYIERGEQYFSEYYQFLQTFGQLIFLHVPEYEEKFLYKGLALYYPSEIQHMTRTLHAKSYKLIPEEWREINKCQCSQFNK